MKNQVAALTDTGAAFHPLWTHVRACDAWVSDCVLTAMTMLDYGVMAMVAIMVVIVFKDQPIRRGDVGIVWCMFACAVDKEEF